jgi:tetratricopeptide (TPR) repeat protein
MTIRRQELRESPVRARLALAALGLAVVGSVSCASKNSAALRPAPFFSPTSTREATNAVDAGDGDMEIASLRKAMTSRPDDVEVRLQLAQAYANRGFADVALEHYRLAAERFPESTRAALRLARDLRKAGQHEEALNGLKIFIKAHPQKAAEPYEWLGILHDDLQQWKDSQASYETALIYAPQSAELHNNLGYSFLMQHLNNSAVMEFRTALRLNKEMTIAWNNLGMALTAEPKEAILNWQAVSGPAAAHNNMAAVLIEQGKYPEARKELEAALGYNQQHAQAIYNLALVAEKDGKPAVLPQQAAPTAQTKTSKSANPFVRLFRSNRKSEKPAASSPGTIAAAASGSGN